jgi:hypothetical protein
MPRRNGTTVFTDNRILMEKAMRFAERAEATPFDEQAERHEKWFRQKMIALTYKVRWQTDENQCIQLGKSPIGR